MSTPAGTGTSTGSGARATVPGRRQLLGAVAMVALGSFLPWIDTPVGTISGARGAGLWTFYAAMLGLAGALVPIRVLALTQGLVLAVVAVALPTWQVLRLLTMVGTSGWTPGPGLVVVFTGGIVAGVATYRSWTSPWVAPLRRR